MRVCFGGATTKTPPHLLAFTEIPREPFSGQVGMEFVDYEYRLTIPIKIVMEAYDGER